MIKQISCFGWTLLSLLLVSSSVVTAAPREGESEGDKSYTSKAVITFKAANSGEGEIVQPVDPINPEKPVNPIDPIDPEKPIEPGTSGPLSLDFASNFHFGNQLISTKDEIYYAKPQMVLAEGGHLSAKPSYVQITDVRGTESGWSLGVAQLEQFKAGERELSGAELTLKTGQVASTSVSDKPSQVTETITLPVDGTQTLLMAASQGEGGGTWVYRMGDEDTMKTGVALSVPGKSVKLKNLFYEATLVWTLKAIPAEGN